MKAMANAKAVGLDSLPAELLKRQIQRLGGRGYNIFVPVLGGNGTKIAHTIFDQRPGQMR